MSVQARLGRVSHNYTYGRAKIIKTQVSINGRSWHRKDYCDYLVSARADSHKHLRVGQIRDFVVVPYTNKNIEGLRGRVRPATLAGEIMIARMRQYEHKPVRESNMWLAPEHPSFRQAMVAIPINDLCSYLHKAPERSGRPVYVNLIPVAKAFVNE